MIVEVRNQRLHLRDPSSLQKKTEPDPQNLLCAYSSALIYTTSAHRPVARLGGMLDV